MKIQVLDTEVTVTLHGPIKASPHHRPHILVKTVCEGHSRDYTITVANETEEGFEKEVQSIIEHFAKETAQHATAHKLITNLVAKHSGTAAASTTAESTASDHGPTESETPPAPQ
jgi:hypothetical protein